MVLYDIIQRNKRKNEISKEEILEDRGNRTYHRIIVRKIVKEIFQEIEILYH